MKIQILQEKLKQGLNIVERISSKSLTLPILNNILITGEKNFLNLSATDLEIGINWWILSKTEKEGKITIPSRLLSSFVSLLPNKKIDLSEKDNNLIIECENYKTQIKGLFADEFPIIPKITGGENVSFMASSFCKGLAQIVDVVVLSTTRPEISGVYFNFQKNLLTLAATDSFRLAEKKISFKDSLLKQEYSLILPQKTIREIINIFSEKTGEIKMFFSPNQVMFEYPMEEAKHAQVQIISRLIEGEYPNYQEIIPKKFTTQIILNKAEFLNQIKTASLFSGKINEVKIKTIPEDKKILISSQSADIGQHQSSIIGKIKGQPIEISFNHKFLLDGLSNIQSSEVVFEMNSDSGPGVLKPLGDDSYIYVVMPIKAS